MSDTSPKTEVNNQAFWLQPKRANRQAILLIHGFLASPCIMRSLGKKLAEAGFLVYAPLLPGHGSHFKALSEVRAADYIDKVEEAYQLLRDSPDIEEVIPLGFSIGATLGLHLSLKHALSKCIALAPAFQISPFAKLLPLFCALGLDKVLPDLRCTQSEPINLASYTRFPMQSVVEIQKLIKMYTTSKNKKTKKQSIYCAASTEDATVHFSAITKQLPHFSKRSHLRVYTNQSKPLCFLENFTYTRVQMQAFEPIEAMSHVGIPVSEKDPYFGKNGSYYGSLPHDTSFGEPTFFNRIRPLKRLTYNPEFENFSEEMIQWLSDNQ